VSQVKIVLTDLLGNVKRPGENIIGGSHPGSYQELEAIDMDATLTDKLGELGQAETPTDVGDIHF